MPYLYQTREETGRPRIKHRYFAGIKTDANFPKHQRVSLIGNFLKEDKLSLKKLAECLVFVSFLFRRMRNSYF